MKIMRKLKIYNSNLHKFNDRKDLLFFSKFKFSFVYNPENSQNSFIGKGFLSKIKIPKLTPIKFSQKCITQRNAFE